MAARVLMDRGGQTRGAAIRAQEFLEKCPRRLRPQGRQRDLPVPRPAHPARAVLGPEVQDQQGMAARHRLPIRALLLHHFAQHGEQLPLLGVCIHARHRQRRIRHPEELEHHWQQLAQLLVHQQQAAGDPVTHRAIRVAFLGPGAVPRRRALLLHATRSWSSQLLRSA